MAVTLTRVTSALQVGYKSFIRPLYVGYAIYMVVIRGLVSRLTALTLGNPTAPLRAVSRLFRAWETTVFSFHPCHPWGLWGTSGGTSKEPLGGPLGETLGDLWGNLWGTPGGPLGEPLGGPLWDPLGNPPRRHPGVTGVE